MSFIMYTPTEVTLQVATRVRESRLVRGWTQAELADRAGLRLATYRQFERTGRISLARLVAVASALGRASDWEHVFKQGSPRSLDEIDRAEPRRRRGTRKVRPAVADAESAS